MKIYQLDNEEVKILRSQTVITISAMTRTNPYMPSLSRERNLINLNKIHEIAGKPKNREPKEWLKLPSAKKIDRRNGGKSPILKTKKVESPKSHKYDIIRF